MKEEKRKENTTPVNNQEKTLWLVVCFSLFFLFGSFRASIPSVFPLQMNRIREREKINQTNQTTEERPLGSSGRSHQEETHERLDWVNGWFLFFFSFLCGSFTMEWNEAWNEPNRKRKEQTNQPHETCAFVCSV